MIAARQIFLGRGGGAKLPYDAEVEYLESTGTQYIDTGVLPTADTVSVIDVAFRSFGSFIYGSFRNYNSVQVSHCINAFEQNRLQFLVGDAVANIYRAYCYHSSTTDTRYTITLTNGAQHGCTVDGGGDIQSLTKLGSGDYSMGLPIHIFGMRRLVSVADDVMISTASIRLYGLRIYNTALVRDMIPVRFTNELGQSEGAMYDRVSGQLFRNAGTGSFLYNDK